MPLSAGTRLGPYEILAPIGAGGMGEVYKARDPRLDRMVAIKVPNEKFSERSEREARAVAALNYPHICQIYDVGPNYLVMEYIEGTPLKGPLPLDEALRYAAQICDALEAAHKKGIVHRDLKPANILVARSGAKLLDFGLARVDKPAPGDETVTVALTNPGTILGTFQYMSPEQLEAKDGDARSDIFSLGAVLYEMLTGRKAFEAKSQASLISAIMEKDPPPVSSLQPLIPAGIDYVVGTCLAKDPEDRWQTAREVKRELLRPGGQGHAMPVSKQARGLRYAVAVLAMATLGLAIVHFREPAREEPMVRTSILPPGESAFTSPVAVSPVGRRLVYGATTADGKSQLWVRPLDALAAQPLGGTEGATHPFWSADGRFVGFFADGKLKKIDVSGGTILTLCDAPSGAGGTWSRDGLIVFNPGSGPGPLHRVSAAGGVSSPVTVMDQSRAESHHRWPWFLPDGRHFVYSAGNAASGVVIRVASVDSNGNDSKVLAESPFNAVYAQGYLLFLRESTLMAQPFDTNRLAATADAVPVAEQIQTLANAGRGVFSVSENGLLIYRTGTTAGGAQLAWFDRGGKPIATLGDPGLFGTLHLSPNQKNVAVSIRDPVTHNQDIWLYDVSRGLKTRFTSDPAEDRDLIWSPDGRTTVFSSNRKGHFDLFQKPSTGAIAEELLYADNLDKQIRSWSPDGKFLLYEAIGPKTKDEIWVLPMTGKRKPYPFAQTTFNELYGQFSPDGRWIAYTSDESQRAEVYVAPFPGPGRKWQISAAGGSQAIWRGDGREIYYMAPDNRLMAAALNLKGDVPDVGAVQRLFGPVACAGGYCYAVSADGQRFLVRTEPDRTTAEPLTLVQNWTASLKK